MPLNRTILLAPLALAALASLTACGPGGITGAVDVPAGATMDSAITVNGSVNVGDGAKVGEAATVNGGVQLGDNVTAGSAKTVNGAIRLGRNTKVARDVVTVNGGVHLAEGADISGRLTNVNGDISLDAAHVGGGITTFNGDIDVANGSRVEGGIHVERPEFSNESSRHEMPRVVIGPGSVVEGPLRFEREVKLYVSESAKIGTVEGATPEMFSGDSPNGRSASTGAPAEPPANTPNEPATGGPEKE